ncbi:MAG TPA: hypothetical protein VFR97_02350 [Capillimicrobium sp.]|nr:hypothetical protein [Capillimicrobium sp.]
MRLRPLDVLGDALHVYGEHWRGLLAGALLIFAPLALLDAVLENHHTASAVATTLEGLAEVALHLFGDVFYGALVAAAAIAWREGARRQRAIDVARSLPWRTIVALDLVISGGSAALSVLLVVPGLVFYVYASLAPSVAKIEHIGVRAALERSVAMVRGSFWRVAAVLAIVEVVSGAVEEALQDAAHLFVADALVNVATESLTAPVYGLATVLMAFALGARSGAHEGE